MQNLLIVEDNIIKSTQIINYISQKNDDLKVYNVSYTYDEAIKMIETQKPDIIILDLKLSDSSYNKIIKYIKENNITKYLHSILIISENTKISSDISNSPYIFSYIQNPYKLEDIQDKLKTMITFKNMIKTKKDTEIIKKINAELKNLGYNFSHNGTKYLSEVIFELYNRKDLYIENLNKFIYPIIAEKYNKSVNTICGNIKQATISMLSNCEEKTIMEYFNYTIFVKPKLKEIIFTIFSKL